MEMPTTSGFQLNRFVPNVRFELIPIKELVSNQDYQRTLSIAHIRRAVENFDLYQINPVKVSRRNGINYVFNGQHTIEIVVAASGSRDTPVWCMVYEDLTYVHEASVFADQQKFVKRLTPMETFIAHIEAKEDKYLMIQDLVRSYHLEISESRGNGNIAAVGALEYIYDKYGYHVLDKSLRLCVGTWEGEQYSFAANILKGSPAWSMLRRRASRGHFQGQDRPALRQAAHSHRKGTATRARWASPRRWSFNTTSVVNTGCPFSGFTARISMIISKKNWNQRRMTKARILTRNDGKTGFP